MSLEAIAIASSSAAKMCVHPVVHITAHAVAVGETVHSLLVVAAEQFLAAAVAFGLVRHQLKRVEPSVSRYKNMKVNDLC